MTKENLVITSGTHFCGKQVILGSFSGEANLEQIMADIKSEFSVAFAEKWGPAVASAKEALNKAVSKTFSKKAYNVQCLSQGHWVISRYEKTTANNVGVDYEPELRVWVDKKSIQYKTENTASYVTLDSSMGKLDDDLANRMAIPSTVHLLFNEWLEVMGGLTGQLLRKAVSEYLRVVGDSVSLTPGNTAGGVQYVPASNWDQVDKYLCIIERNSDVRFNRFGVVKDDAEAMKALTDSLIEEAEAEIKAVREEMDSHMRVYTESDEAKKGDKLIAKQSTFESREKNITAVKAKLERFAVVCGNAFGDIDAKLTSVGRHVVAAKFTATK
jgi:hypothetical protein